MRRTRAAAADRTAQSAWSSSQEAASSSAPKLSAGASVNGMPRCCKKLRASASVGPSFHCDPYGGTLHSLPTNSAL